MTIRRPRSSQAGYLMIEVLITMFILAVGLLGVVGLQARAQQAETDSYQRTQALVLLRDMAARINANHEQAFDTTVSPYLVPANDPLGYQYRFSSTDCAAPATTCRHRPVRMERRAARCRRDVRRKQRRHDDRRARMHHTSGDAHVSDRGRLAGADAECRAVATVDAARTTTEPKSNDAR